jgi:hypothetical protein
MRSYLPRHRSRAGGSFNLLPNGKSPSIDIIGMRCSRVFRFSGRRKPKERDLGLTPTDVHRARLRDESSNMLPLLREYYVQAIREVNVFANLGQLDLLSSSCIV